MHKKLLLSELPLPQCHSWLQEMGEERTNVSSLPSALLDSPHYFILLIQCSQLVTDF